MTLASIIFSAATSYSKTTVDESYSSELIV